MSQNPLDNPKIVIIDIEEIFINELSHPEHDPGVVIKYRIKIDEQYFEVAQSHLSGKSILELVDKNTEHYNLKQRVKREGQIHLIDIPPHEQVNLKEPGIEKFITEQKEYIFFVQVVKDIEYKTRHAHLTVRKILEEYAKVDPNENTLAEKQTSGVHEFPNLSEELDLKHIRHFIVFSERPTTVS
jgi:hypothetical protein